MAGKVTNAQAISEWYAPVQGFIAACGEAAAYMVAAAEKGISVSNQGLRNLVSNVVGAGQGNASGQTVAGIQYDLSQLGISSRVQNPQSEAQLQTILNQALQQNKGVVLGVSYGAALSNEPASLRGHFVAIEGQNPNGSYIVGDPNTSQSTQGQFVTDTLNQLWNAQPFGTVTPTGAGPTQCQRPGPNGSIGDWIKYAACLSNELNPNQPNIPATQNAANTISDPIGTGFQDIGTWFNQTFGITSGADFTWRVLFIGLAIFLFLLGVLIFALDVLDKSNVEVAGTRV